MENKITLTTDEFKAITDRLTQLEKGVISIKPSRVKEHTAAVAIVGGSPVIKWDSVKDDGTITGKNYKINVYTLDGKEYKLPYLEFIYRTPKVIVKILKQETQTKEEIEFGKGGGGVVSKIDQKTDKFTGDEVELSVTYVETKLEVEVMEGDLQGTRFEINANYVNP